MGKVAITTTGRTGSRFIWQVLKQCGLDVGEHEKRFGKDGGVITNGFYPYYDKPGFTPSKEHKLFIQVREPLACISSL